MFEERMRELMDGFEEIIESFMKNSITMSSFKYMSAEDLDNFRNSMDLLEKSKELYIELGKTVDENRKTMENMNNKLDEILALERSRN